MSTGHLADNTGAATWIDPALYPFQHRWITIDGHRVHYLDEGSGPTLLLLHGNPTWSFLYRDIILALRDRYRCVAPDYPGFGLSVPRPGYRFTPKEHAAVVEQFVREIDLQDATLMIHDWGGPIGMVVAEHEPERFRAFVIGNTWAWPVDDDPRFEMFSRLMGGPIGWFLIRYLNGFVNLMLPFGTRRRLSRDLMFHYRRPFRGTAARLPAYRFAHAILHSRGFLQEVAAGLPRLAHKPALIVWGANDPAFQVPERERWERLFTNHRTVMLQEAGHFIQEDAPAAIAASIRDWMPAEGSSNADGSRYG